MESHHFLGLTETGGSRSSRPARAVTQRNPALKNKNLFENQTKNLARCIAGNWLNYYSKTATMGGGEYR